MTSGSSTIMLCADQAWEMVVCGERVGKHVFFARLPTSQRLHHPAHLKNQPNTTKKRASSGSAARRRGASCAPTLRPNRNARGAALAATSVAVFLRVMASRAPVFDTPHSSTARHSVTTGRPRRRVSSDGTGSRCAKRATPF